VKKYSEARNSKTPYCQQIILELLPRLASFVDINSAMPFSNVPDATDNILSIVNKNAEAMLSLGLLALYRPNEIRPKIPHILNLIIQRIQLETHKSIFQL
jgi:hypothetical protein